MTPAILKRGQGLPTNPLVAAATRSQKDDSSGSEPNRLGPATEDTRVTKKAMTDAMRTAKRNADREKVTGPTP